MSTIADERNNGRSPWPLRIGAAVTLVVALVLVVTLVRKLIGQADGPRQQTTRIAILPDTPPPPPPSPKDEPKKEPPKEVASKQLQQDVPKPAPAPPADSPVKLDEAAGNGNSSFGAGSVTKDAASGATFGNAASAGGAGVTSDRAKERFYANSAKQLLRDEMERQLRPDAGELTVSFVLWVEPDGRIRRYELIPSTEEPSARKSADNEIRAALDGASRELRLPPPEGLPQPLRFRLTLRSAS